MRRPADAHVHSEWSWDTGGPAVAAGRMRATCERAVAIGLPALIFTEHLDFDGWRAGDHEVPPHLRPLRVDGVLRPPPLDVDGWREGLDRCRHAFPDLAILSGVEFGQPHRFAAQAAALLDLDSLDRVNGSLHVLDLGDGFAEPGTLFLEHPAGVVMEAYLAEVPRMVADAGDWPVVTHLDYAVRSWPVEQEGPFDPRRFEEGFRGAMRAIAASGRALEMNTRRLRAWLPQWWAEEGGRAVSFGSDAHVPAALAGEFPEAVALLEHLGFRPGSRPWDLWTR